MPTINTLSGRHFEAEPGEVLLDAALRSGVTLEYSCKTGRCGTCVARRVSGATRNVRDDLYLTDAQRAAGQLLTCVSTAQTDTLLEVRDLGNARLYPVRTLPCRIQSLEALADDVMRVELRLPPNATFEFHAGQYVDIIGHAGLRRSYSIANRPRSATLEFHVRQVPDGAMSDYWFGAAKVNDLLRLSGPLGTSFLRGVAAHDLVFLATGTGMAPIKSMLEQLASQAPSAQEAPRSVSIFWGGRRTQDLYWNPVPASPGARYVPVLSRAGANWTGARGYVHEVMLAESPDLQEAIVYACGSDAMVRSARAALVAAGLPDARFHADPFVCSAT